VGSANLDFPMARSLVFYLLHQFSCLATSSLLVRALRQNYLLTEIVLVLEQESYYLEHFQKPPNKFLTISGKQSLFLRTS
jgi:hypothetical protein